jgi:electron transfer flavoprotein alpha subunit
MAGENGVLIICETDGNGDLRSITGELLAAARGLADSMNGESVSAALIGSGVAGKAQDVIALGADTVYVVDNPVFEHYLGETFVPAALAVREQANPKVILIGHTPNGRELGPSLGFRLETGVSTDTTEVSIDSSSGGLVAARSLAGGLFRQVTAFNRLPHVATVHMKAYDASEPDSSRTGQVVTVDASVDASQVRTRFVNHTKVEVQGIRMEDARVVVCGGRGMGSVEGFDELAKFAEMTGGAVAATRAAADSGYCGQDIMIGITGRVVSPEVYLAIALSGASQHMAGCSGSKSIIAINRDPEANIFKESRFGVVGDYQQVLPALIEELEKLGTA